MMKMVLLNGLKIISDNKTTETFSLLVRQISYIFVKEYSEGLIAVDDKELVARLKSVINPPIAESAPAFICVLTQRINAYRDKCYSVQDYSAAIENMLLALEELGYQSCWYEGHITDDDRICDKLADILGVPDGYDLVCILPIGKGISKTKEPMKKSFHERAWFNGFGKVD